jgi:plasmid stabilization system protein ParE
LNPRFADLVDELTDWPLSHRVVEGLPAEWGELRRAYPAGFPNHAVYYRVTEDEMIITRVLHAARDVGEALGE